jgi:hypothetical protein
MRLAFFFFTRQGEAVLPTAQSHSTAQVLGLLWRVLEKMDLNQVSAFPKLSQQRIRFV